VNKVWNANSGSQKKNEQKKDEVLMPLQPNIYFPFPEADEKPNDTEDEQWYKRD